MSKIIGRDNKATAWAVPKISDLKKDKVKKQEKAPDELSAKELKKIEEQINKVKQQAYQEGFSKGQQDGLAAAQEQIEQMLRSLQSLIEGMSEPLKHMDSKVESELVNLAVAIAKQIVRRELKTDPGQVVAVVREALSIIPTSSQSVRVYLNPDDSQLVRQIIPPNAGERTWEVIDDPVLSRGSCRVETETTVVDASFESRIAAIAAEILGSERSND